MGFEGLPRQGLDFLEHLGRNNERSWFEQHRAEYEADLLEPARDLVVAMGEEFDRVGIDVHADPKVGGSIMRIARDTRFSKDKRPYKTHLDLWFWQGERASRESPGYWFRLTATALTLGAGMHRFERSLLERYREAVVDPARGEALAAAIAALPYDVEGRTYKRVPAGYEAEHPRAELLLHGGLYAGEEIDVPAETYTSRFPAFCIERYAQLRPLQDWLLELTPS